VANIFSDDGLKARFARSSFWRVLHFGGTQFMRLLSNLILTRLLFPEAFGLMALVTIVLAGMSMFSDTGIVTAIQQNKRADEPRFRDTAWTIQIIRGWILWILTWPLAWGVSVFYEAPELALMIPVAGLSLVVDGVRPTRVFTAQRHLQVGRLTAVEFLGAFLSMALTILFAWWLETVWALVISLVLGRVVSVGLQYVLMEGRRDRLFLDKDIAFELLHFGKWILVSTTCTFFNNQGDRLILGKYLTLEALGIYNIAYFLASVPMLLGQAVFQMVLVPYLRQKPPNESHANFLAFRSIRLRVTGGLICMTIGLALLGPYIVPVMYDSRYHAAGSIIVLISLASVPLLIILNYPFAAYIAQRHGAWDKVLDGGLYLLAVLGGLATYVLHHAAIADVFLL